MEQRYLDSKTKAFLVLQGMSGKSKQELCHDYAISHQEYEDLQNHFLLNAHRVFEKHPEDENKRRLEDDNVYLKGLVGELVLEVHRLRQERHKSPPYMEDRKPSAY